MAKKENSATQTKSELSAIIARTDKENPKPADIAAMHRFLNTDEGIATVRANEPTRAAMNVR